MIKIKNRADNSEKRKYFPGERTPCIRHNCISPCCEFYEVRLSEFDIKRLAAAGLEEEEFLEYTDGYVRLRRDDNVCVFLKNKACSIHPNRPEACRIFPWVLSNGKLKKEDFCLFHEEFSKERGIRLKLENLIKTQEKEREKRSICLTESCSACCRDTEMPLSFADIRRLTRLGHRDFYIYRDGDLLLRNIGNKCIFLDKKGRCSVYENRPEGCGYYPFILGRIGIELDMECPYKEQFKERFSKGLEEDVKELVERLDKERSIRLKENMRF